MVEKILYDLKNGGLRKRGRAQYDLELSDDEDDELRQYRLKKRELMRQKAQISARTSWSTIQSPRRFLKVWLKIS